MPPEHENVSSSAARLEQLQREAVDVLVGARGLVGVRRGGRELGRVEHDGVEALAGLEQVAQQRVDVGVARLVRAGSKPLSVTCSVARASAGADESTLITCVAPPASAATEKPPV